MKVQYSVLLPLVALVISGVQAGTVTNNSDSGPGSLREVLGAAGNNGVIDFDQSLNGATITLSSGALTTTGLTLTIDASALASGVTLSGDHSSSILRIGEDEGTLRPDVTLKKLHLRNGNNTSGYGGGIYAFQCHLVMEACSIRDCVSATVGGDLLIGNGGGILAYQSELVLEACVIRDCSSAADGGGIWGNAVSGSIKRCMITGNQSGGYGGGIFLIGVSTNSLGISSSQISGNKSLNGGGIYNFSASPRIANCSVQGNLGGGLQNFAPPGFPLSEPVLRNSIVWGNSASGGSTTAPEQLGNSGDSHPDVDYCLIEGASDATSFKDGNLVVWGSGNLDGTLAANDPQFVGAVPAANAPSSAANLRVLGSSPVWNRGNNAFGSTALDLAGNVRIQNVTIDLGAYESGCDYAVWAALYADNQTAGLDHDNDGVPNGVEYFMGQTGSGFTSIPAVVNSAGVLTWAWPRDPNASAAFKFQISDTLDGTDWEDVVPPDPSINTTDPNQVIYTFGPKHFCRFVVTP